MSKCITGYKAEILREVSEESIVRAWKVLGWKQHIRLTCPHSFSSVCLWPLLDIKFWTLWMISINNYECSYVPAGLKHDSKFYLPCWTITNILCRFISLMDLKITKNIQGLTHFSLFEVTPYWHILISQKFCKNTMSFMSRTVSFVNSRLL